MANQEYKTTTRGGKKVDVRHYDAKNGDRMSVEANGRGYEVLNVDRRRKK